MAKHVPRIYCEKALTPGARLRLPDEASHHLMHVLRLKTGAELTLFDGRGGEYAATLESAGKQGVDATVGAHRPVNRESGLRMTLAQGISRGERMDYSIQKAVELGVDAIVPLQTERSVGLAGERQDKKLRHWQSIARSAAEQSGRDRVPEVRPMQEFGAWLATVDATALRLVLDPAGDDGLRALSLQGNSVILLAGPEGGLTDDEICAATHTGFIGLRMGPRVLRTETAGMAAIAAIQTLWGDLGG